MESVTAVNQTSLHDKNSARYQVASRRLRSIYLSKSLRLASVRHLSGALSLPTAVLPLGLGRHRRPAGLPTTVVWWPLRVFVLCCMRLLRMEEQASLYSKCEELLNDPTRKRIVLIPAGVLESMQAGSNGAGLDSTIGLCRFPHPGSSATVLWKFDSRSGDIFQLLQMEEKCGSWFVGNYVLEDGSLFCLVPMDPLLLIIPLLLESKKRRRVQPLGHILSGGTSVCDYGNAMSALLEHHHKFFKDVDLICSCTEMGGEAFYKLSKSKLAAWVRAKVTRLADSLERERTHVGTRVIAAGYEGTGAGHSRCSKEQYERYAFGMFCDYLPESIRSEIAKTLKMEDPVAAVSTEDKKRKLENSEQAAEDYSRSLKSIAPAPAKKLTAAQKQLQKVDKTGMKSISSYFTRAKATDKNSK